MKQTSHPIFRLIKIVFASLISLMMGITSSVAQVAGIDQFSRIGRILDGENDQPVAFAVIIQQGTSNGAFTDIDGRFQLSLDNDSSLLLIQCIGYKPLELTVAMLTPEIKLFPDHVTLKEIVIRPGINPAERIIRSAIARKAKNNPEKSNAFTYESYNRLAFGAELDSTLVHHPDSLAQKDSSTIEMYQFFDQQYLFLMETVAKRKFLPPNSSEETIIANRVSGLKNTDFFVLATQLQSFSFYGEVVELMSQRYMSPLADNSISKYLFIIENTSVLQQDTIWTISFRPRKNKNFEGMEGVLYINSNGYALQQVTAAPVGNVAQSIKIQQQYELIDQTQWFPVQLNSIIYFNGIMANNTPLVGDGKSYLRNIKLQPDLQTREFSPIVLQMDKNASLPNDSIWSIHRPNNTSAKDIKTYQVIDSVGEAMNFDKKVKLMESLFNGKWKLGPIDLDLNRLFAYNKFEGFRAGLGFHTNDEVFKSISLGGYYAYGFVDKGHKYGGDMIWHLHRARGIEMKLSYTNDLQETGGNQMEKLDRSLFKSVYPIFVSRMDRREIFDASFRGRWWSNLSGMIGTQQQRVQSWADYEWVAQASDQISLVSSDFNLLESYVSLRFAPGEKIVRMGQKEVAIAGKWPVCTMRYGQTWDDSKWSDVQYSRLDLMINKSFYILNVGELSLNAVAGKITGDAPAPLLYNARGSYGRFTISAPNTFETMRTNEFMHDAFVAFHARHNFKHLLFRRPKFEPQLVISQSSLFGQLNNTDEHSIDFKSATKGYHESGLSINGLLKSSFNSLGIGIFYRYGPYHLGEMKENFAYKITSIFTF